MKTPMIHPPSRSLLSLLPRRLALAGAIASVAGIVPAQADFSGAYAPEAWTPYPTVSDDSALVGKPATVDIAGAPGTLTLHAKQGYMWSGSTSFYLVTAPVAGTVTFDWTFESGDPGNNSVGYAVNPDIQGWGYAGMWDNPQNHSGCIQLAGRDMGGSSPANGTVSVTVNAGDRVGVYAHNAFYNGEARIIISNFSGPGATTTLHTIDASVGVEGGGGISPQGTTVDAVDGFPKIFFIIPDGNNRVSEVLVNGTAVTLPLPGATFPYYEFPAVTTDGQSIVASFVDPPIWNIAVNAGTGGSISPAGPDVPVFEGDSQTFTVTPDKYFDVTSVLVNGATEVLTGPDKANYTLANVTADGSIAANFTEWTPTFITGKVALIDGTGVAGFAVAATGGREPYQVLSSDGSVDPLGTFSFRVKPGVEYVVTAVKQGWTITPASFTAGPGDLVDKNFVATYVGVQKLIDLKIDSTFVDGSPLTNWPNLGTLGGAFVVDGGKETAAPTVVDSYVGKKAVQFGNSKMMLSTDATTADASLIRAPGWLTGNSSYTVHAQICSTTALSYEQYYLAWAHNGGDANCAAFGYGTSGGFGAVAHWGWTDMGWKSPEADGGPSINEWHYVDITFDGTTEKVYLDGVEVNREPKTLSSWLDNPFTLGCRFDNDNGEGRSAPFTGALAGLTVYDSALTAEQIAALSTVFDPNDTDADGMPDAWEMSQVGNLTDLTKTGDFDGDGTSDYTEYRLGLIPNDGTSMFKVTIVRDPVTGDVTLTWPSQLDLKFTVRWTRDFSQANPWEDLITLTDTDGGPTESFTDTGISGEPIGFYRIVLKP